MMRGVANEAGSSSNQCHNDRRKEQGVWKGRMPTSMRAIGVRHPSLTSAFQFTICSAAPILIILDNRDIRHRVLPAIRISIKGRVSHFGSLTFKLQ